MSTSQADGFPTLNGLRGPGRPSKRNKKVVAELLDAIASGAPFNLACQAAGLQPATFCDWRRRDPAFALEVDQAAARGTISRLKEIEAQGKGGACQALSWLVERRHPAEFARPEVALNIGIQNNLNAQGGSGNSFESVIVADLEFLKLREHENYEHRAHERPAREVEAEVIPVEVSGVLTRADHPGATVVSESQAAANQRRIEEADARIAALFAAKAKSGEIAQNGGTPHEEPAASGTAMALAPIRMPESEPGQWWWKQILTGSGEREIERTAAIEVCRIILRDALGGLAAQSISINFAPGAPIRLRDLHAMIQDRAGARGWSALVRMSERS